LAALSSILIVALCAVLLVAQWRVYTKAGVPGWACLIPVYNLVKLLHITGRSGWWILGFGIPLLNFFVLIRMVFDLAKAFGRGVGFGFGLLLLSPVFIPILGFGKAHYVGRGASA
jgi:uncharacterized membrane protein YhaH (DUF805 family)